MGAYVIGGRYSLGREIGRGGMGAVWLGRDEVLGRAVAIKRVGAVPGGTSPDLVRAEREARIAARVNHPHVVAIFDLVREDGQNWLVMEYVEGRTLAEQIQATGPLTPAEAAPILAQAAEALSAAHDAGVVHRDVKPSNILVSPEGQVKLSDFGIARAEADASLTATGLVTGSPAYIAPEVASGRTATGASDVWSLGATAFHALSGRPPYEVSDNVLGTLYRIVHEEPPRLEDGGWLASFVNAAMTRDPARRWSMNDVSAFLRAEGRDPGPSLLPPVPAYSSEGDEHSTQLLSTVPAQDYEPSPPPPGGTDRRSRRRPVLPLVVGASALVLAVMIGLLLLNDDDPSAGTADGRSASPAPSQTTRPARPDAESIEKFATDYLTTAAADPQAGYRMLTPEFQAESGGLPGYEGFWGRVSNVRIDDIQADVAALTVTYTYTYDLAASGVQTDTVELQLVQGEDGGYLIAEDLTLD
ncbi:MAG: serine/threonine protein kinase [Actinomycetota bacterium]|nr:serine/threonine protein kinase [Actinomycetota bacterium]